MINKSPTQRHGIIFLQIFIALAIAVSFSSAYAQFGDGLDDKRQAVEAMFKRAGGDGRAQGSAWPEARVFAVGVKKDMGYIDEYAEYVCNVLKDNGLGGKDVYVEIVDIDRLYEARGGWKALKKLQCK